MFWKIVATLGAVTFLVAGLDALSLDCDAVEFGGSRRSVTYSCTAPGADGGMSPGAAGALMLLGALAILVVAWGPSVYRATADTRDLKQGSWNQFTAGTDTPSRSAGKAPVSTRSDNRPQLSYRFRAVRPRPTLRNPSGQVDIWFSESDDKVCIREIDSDEKYTSTPVGWTGPDRANLVENRSRGAKFRVNGQENIAAARRFVKMLERRQNVLVGDTEEPEQHLQTPATPTLTDEAVSETLLRSEVSNLEGHESVFAPLLAVDPQHAAPSTSREDRRNNGTVDAGQAAGLKAKDSMARADIAESLRQLKALHDEGLLTKDEYETKRKALADQL